MSDNLRNRLLGLVNAPTTTASSNPSTNNNTSQPSNAPSSNVSFLQLLQGNNTVNNTASIAQQQTYNPAAPLPLASTPQPTASYADLMNEFKRTPIYLDLKRQSEEKTLHPEELKKQAQAQFQKFAETKGFSSQQIIQMQKMQQIQHAQHLQQQQQHQLAQQQIQQSTDIQPTQPTSSHDEIRTQLAKFQRLDTEEKKKYLQENPEFRETLRKLSQGKNQQQQQVQQPTQQPSQQLAAPTPAPITAPIANSLQSAPNTNSDPKTTLLELSKIYGKNPSFIEVYQAYSTNGATLSQFFNHLRNCKSTEEGNNYIETVKKTIQSQMLMQLQMNPMYMGGMLNQQMAAAVANSKSTASLNSQLLQQLQQQNQQMQGMSKTVSSASLINANGSNSTFMPPPQQPSSTTANPLTGSKDTNKTRRPASSTKESAAKKEKKADDRSVLASANVDEEKEMASKEIIVENEGTPYNPQDPFLNLNNLRTKLQRIAYQNDLERVNDSVLKFMSQAVEFRIRNIMEKALEASQYRQEAYRPKDAIVVYTSKPGSLEYKNQPAAAPTDTPNNIIKESKKDYAASALSSFTAGVTLKPTSSKPILAFDAASKVHATPNKTFPSTISKTPNRTYNPNSNKAVTPKDVIRTLEQEEQSCKSTMLQNLYLKYYS